MKKNDTEEKKMILNALDEVLFWDDIGLLKSFIAELVEKYCPQYYPENRKIYRKTKNEFLLSHIPSKEEFTRRIEHYISVGKPVWVSGRNGLSDDINTKSLKKAIDISSKLENGKAKAEKVLEISNPYREFWDFYASGVLHTENNCILEMTVGAGFGTSIVMKNMKPTDCYIGVDIDFICAKNADAIAQYFGVRGLGLAASLWNLPFEDNMFTSVCCCTGLEECREIETILSEAARVLAPKGRIVLRIIHGEKSSWMAYFRDYGFDKAEAFSLLERARLFANEKQVENILNRLNLKFVDVKRDDLSGYVLIFEK